jgi:hypothetical protein
MSSNSTVSVVRNESLNKGVSIGDCYGYYVEVRVFSSELVLWRYLGLSIS